MYVYSVMNSKIKMSQTNNDLYTPNKLLQKKCNRSNNGQICEIDICTEGF